MSKTDGNDVYQEMVERLHAENARLRAEVEDLREWKKIALDMSAAQFADLFRVTGERDALEHDRNNLLCQREQLLAAARGVLESAGVNATSRAMPDEVAIKYWGALLVAVAECAPPVVETSTQCKMCHSTGQVLVQGIGMVEIRPCPACAPAFFINVRDQRGEE